MFYQLRKAVAAALASLTRLAADNSPMWHDGHRVGPGRKTLYTYWKNVQPSVNKPLPPGGIGEHYADFIVGRQLHRQLARMVLKDARHKAMLQARKDAHLAMLSRRRLRLVYEQSAC